VKPLLVVKTEVLPEPLFSFRYRLIFVQKHLLVFHRAPQPLDEDVVVDPAPEDMAGLDAP